MCKSSLVASLTHQMLPHGKVACLADPIKKLNSCVAVNQEAARKGVDRGFGVLNLKFQMLTHPINLHHWDGMYYVFLACILMHNVMVEA